MDNTECCPEFKPAHWEETEITWTDKPFVQDRVRCLFHIPINFGAVMKRTMARVEAAQAKAEDMILLADDDSLWGCNVFLHVTKEVPQAAMTTISGTFLSKVFEGPYSQMRNWIKQMQEYLASTGKTAKKLYFYYTTCPKCAKKYGKNYVVILAQV